MTDKIELRNKIQDEAINAWVESGYRGAILSMMGTGKSCMAFKSIFKLFDYNLITFQDEIQIFNVTKLQEDNLKTEFNKYNEIFNCDIWKFNLVFKCYASKVNGNPVYLIGDEFDTISIHAKDHFINRGKYILLLSGTESASMNIYRNATEGLEMRQSDEATKAGEITPFINKGQLIDIIAPICFRYEFEDALRDKLIAPIETTIINHPLDSTNKVIKLWKSYDTRVSEYDWWAKKDGMRKDFRKPFYLKGIIGKEMAKFLYNLPSKRHVATNLLKNIQGKTIIFGAELALLHLITPNVITSKSSTSFVEGMVYYSIVKRKRNKKQVNVYQKKHLLRLDVKEITKDEYDLAKEKRLKTWIDGKELIRQFNEGEINTIASSKSIGRGITLNQLENAIFVSYTSSYPTEMQKLARCIRLDMIDKIANIYFIRTVNTFEEKKWFPGLSNIKGKKGEIKEIDLNIIQEIHSGMLSIPEFKLK